MVNKVYIYAFIVYYAFMIYMYEKNLKKLKPLFENPELHKKYKAFDRPDKGWFRNRLIAYLTIWVFVPRMIFGFGLFAVMAVLSIIFSAGVKFSNEFKYGKIKYFLIMTMYNTIGRLIHMSLFTFVIKRKRSKTICYKKYLGEDWKPDFDGFAGTTISNHQAFQDVFVHSCYQLPAFVMKQSGMKFPLLKYLALVGQCIVISNDKSKTFEEIEAR